MDFFCSDKKIQIKNLKFSAVYQQTLKEVEEQEAQRRAKYEEGELESSAVEEQHHDNVEGTGIVMRNFLQLVI